jgi:hypothetical protein
VAFPFLSDEWIAAARAVRAEYEDRAPSVPVSIRMNQVITDVPFGEGVIRAHIDTSGGAIELELGHLDGPDVTITLEYPTARSILVGGDVAAIMQAFMGGRIKIDGNLGKLLELQTSGALGGGGDAVATEVYERIRAITE